MSNLTWHTQSIPGWAATIINNDPVKLIDPPSDNPLPGRRIIGRVYMPDEDSNALCARGGAGAALWWARVAPIMTTRRYVWAWCLPNEPQPVADWNFCNLLADFTIAAAQIMHANGLLVIGGELAEGNPGGPTDAERANLFCAIARGLAVCDYWSQHAYWVPDGYPHPEAGYNQWHALRYQLNRSYARARGIKLPKVILTEAGWDFGIVGKPRQGWRSYSDWRTYFADLRRFDADLRADPDCLGATLFVSGANQDWRDFEIGEPESKDLAAYIASSAPVVPPVLPPTLAARLQAAFSAQFHDLRATLPHGAPPYAKRPLSAIHQTLLHHTATALTTTWESIANYHVNSLGWPGVGYHIGVHADGRVSLLNNLETISYHAGVANGNSVSICVVGNYEKDAVSDALWRRIQEVKAVVDEHLGRVLPFIGHRDAPGNATVCPGKNLEARLKVPEVPMSDPRASNCRAFHINADGKVDGIALVYQPVPSARYACVKAELIDEAQAQGNTVVTVSILDENGILTAERALMVWPYGEPLAEDAPAGPGNTDNRFSIAGGKYTPPAIGPLGFIVGDAADKAISDYIWGYGLPGNRHISGRVTFKERSAVPPVEPPITPPDSLTDALVEQIRNLAANNLTVGMSAGVPYNPTLAFPKKARELKLGAQTTLELRQIKGWVVQGFALGILVCPDGKWSEMTLVTY